MKEEYGDQEREYLIRRYMGLSANQWDTLQPDEKEEFLDMKLWIKENFKIWKKTKR